MRIIQRAAFSTALIIASSGVATTSQASGGTIGFQGAVANPTCQLRVSSDPTPTIHRLECPDTTATNVRSATPQQTVKRGDFHSDGTWLRTDGTVITGGQRAIQAHLTNQPAIYMIDYR